MATTTSLCLGIRGDNAAAGTMGSVAVWLVIQHSRVSSRGGIPKRSQQLNSQALDDGMGWLLHHLSFEQQDVASLHQSTGDSTGTPICVLTSLSPWCHLHVHDCFAKLWKVSSIWFFPTQFVRRLVLCGRSVGLRKLRCVIPHDTHGAMFSPFSELLRSLARQFHSAAILQRHSPKIVLFLQCIEPVTSWEHCIDHSTTSARLSQLGFHLQPRDREESFLPLQQDEQEPPKHKSFRLSVSQLRQPKLRSDDLQPKSDYQDKNTHPSPLKSATHVSLPLACCSIFRGPQRVCHGSRRALQVNCPEIPPYLGLMFEPSAHCPDCRKSILFFFCFF